MKTKDIVVCPSCAAEFSKDNAKCPFCGVMYYQGAEKAYMEHLESVKEELSELQYLPEETIKEEVRSVGKLLRKVVIILVILVAVIAGLVYWLVQKQRKQDREDFLYQHANYPVFDEMYDNGEYDALSEKYNEALLNGDDMWSWEHRDFISAYNSVKMSQDVMARIDGGEVLGAGEYARLLWDEWNVVMYLGSGNLDEQEKAYIDAIAGDVIADLKTRWGMSEEQLSEWYDRLAADYYIITYDECKKFIKDWMKRNGK